MFDIVKHAIFYIFVVIVVIAVVVIVVVVVERGGMRGGLSKDSTLPLSGMSLSLFSSMPYFIYLYESQHSAVAMEW